MASVELIAVRKSYGDTEVIHGIDLAIASGEFVVFVGPSGCGKSTLLRMIAGLESITDGEIRIDGVKVNDKPPRSRDIAMVFQDYALYPHKSVRDNMAFGLKLRKFPRAEIERRVRDAAATLKIEPFLDRLPRALSGGQRQRVAMGRAIVRQPKAFLFDEPLSNLDALLRNEVRVEIKKLHQRLRETIVYVTHDQVEAMTLADRIVVLEAGRIGQIGPPDEIYERPRDRFVAGFIGSPPMNFLPAVVERDGDGYALRIGTAQRLRIPVGSAGRYAASAGRSVMLGVRPEHLSIDGRETAGPRLDAEVVVVEPLGAENLVTFKVGAHELRGRFKAGVRPGVGGALSLAVDPERIHLFDAETGRAL